MVAGGGAARVDHRGLHDDAERLLAVRARPATSASLRAISSKRAADVHGRPSRGNLPPATEPGPTSAQSTLKIAGSVAVAAECAAVARWQAAVVERQQLARASRRAASCATCGSSARLPIDVPVCSFAPRALELAAASASTIPALPPCDDRPADVCASIAISSAEARRSAGACSGRIECARAAGEQRARLLACGTPGEHRRRAAAPSTPKRAIASGGSGSGRTGASASGRSARLRRPAGRGGAR